MSKRVKLEKQTNKLAEIFYEMADILELKKEKWKPQAYRIAAQTIESLKEDIEDIYLEKGIKGFEELPGIGEGIAKKIVQFIESEKIEEYEKLKKSIPQGLYEMMNIPGIGVKRASLFYHKLKIKNIKELEKAAKKHKLLGLPGFKEQAEKKILEGISSLEIENRIPLKQAEKIANRIISELKKLKEIEKVEIAGSIRRKKSMIRDIDLVVQTKKPEIVAEKFTKMSFVDKILGKGKEKATIITKDRMQADVRFFTEKEYGAGLLYFTGDKQHNIWLRKIAIKKGWKLNEYGLFQGRKRIAGRTEKEIYDKLGVKIVGPEKRIGEVLG